MCVRPLPAVQACKFRDEYVKFTDAGAQVFGISSDTPEDNKAFATAQRLPFPLLSDPSSILRKVRQAYFCLNGSDCSSCPILWKCTCWIDYPSVSQADRRAGGQGYCTEVMIQVCLLHTGAALLFATCVLPDTDLCYQGRHVGPAAR